MGVLTDALTLVLGHVEDGYTADNITDAPGRRYLSPGAPPADCELVAVWGVPQAKQTGGNSDPRLQNCTIIPQAAIEIASWLCVPTGTPPSEEALAAAAAKIADHLWAVWAHLAHLVATKTFYEGQQNCAAVQLLNPTQIVDEEGAFAGWQISILLDLNPLLTDPAS